DNDAATVNNVHLTNSTVINAVWVGRYGNGVRSDRDAMGIEGSAFFNSPHHSKYMIDMQRTGSTIGSFLVSNTLFGYTKGSRPFNRFTPSTISVTNSFATSDANWDRGLIAGVTAHSATSEQVFAAPDKINFANSDLTIIDES